MINSTIHEFPLVSDGSTEIKGFRLKQIYKSHFDSIYEINIIKNAIWNEVFGRKEYLRFDKIANPKFNSFVFTAWTCGSPSQAEEILRTGVIAIGVRGSPKLHSQRNAFSI